MVGLFSGAGGAKGAGTEALPGPIVAGFFACAVVSGLAAFVWSSASGRAAFSRAWSGGSGARGSGGLVPGGRYEQVTHDDLEQLLPEDGSETSRL